MMSTVNQSWDSSHYHLKAVIVKMIQSLTTGSLETKEKYFQKYYKGKQQAIKRTKWK